MSNDTKAISVCITVKNNGGISILLETRFFGAISNRMVVKGFTISVISENFKIRCHIMIGWTFIWKKFEKYDKIYSKYAK